MANYGPASAFLLVGGNDLSSESYGLDENVEELAEETRGLGAANDAWKNVGVAKVTLDVAPGLYTDAVFKQIAALESNQSSRKLISYGVEGAALGANAVMVDGAFVSNFKRMAQEDGLTLAGGTYVVSGQYYGGRAEDGTGGPKIIGINTSRAGDGDTESTSVDNAASSAFGLIADLHIPALDLGGGTNVVVTISDSPDDAVWTPLGSFAAATSESAGTSERITVAGTIDRYLSISWVFTGGAAQTVTPYVVAYRNPA